MAEPVLDTHISCISVQLPAELEVKARDYAAASKAASTLRAYNSVWRSFCRWCLEKGLDPLPASGETIIGYLVDHASKLRPQTLKKHLAAISVGHQAKGLSSPTSNPEVRLTLQGIRRQHGASAKPKKALRLTHVRGMVDGLGGGPAATRDRAIVLIGFSTGMRRSELAALQIKDVEFEPEGIVVAIRKSKRDQDGRGRHVLAPLGKHTETCPVRAVRRWLDHRGPEVGPLFCRQDRAAQDIRPMSGRAIAEVIKRAAASAGLDPKVFSGHSLRRGFCSEAARAGASEREIALATGHKSMMVLRGYIEQGRLAEDCAARYLDL